MWTFLEQIDNDDSTSSATPTVPYSQRFPAHGTGSPGSFAFLAWDGAANGIAYAHGAGGHNSKNMASATAAVPLKTLQCPCVAAGEMPRYRTRFELFRVVNVLVTYTKRIKTTQWKYPIGRPGYWSVGRCCTEARWKIEQDRLRSVAVKYARTIVHRTVCR